MPDHQQYDISVIKRILPHRSPFLFVDRVIKIEGAERIAAEKYLSIDEPFFAGHLPGRPIMPGVLVSEALAQTSGLLLGLAWKELAGLEEQDMPGFFFLASINVKFFTPAMPGDTLCLESSLKKKFGNLFLFEVNAHVPDNRIAGGTLALAEEKA